MVRHQLSLHGAGTAQGSDFRAGLAQADRGIPGSQGAGLPDPPGADRAGHVSETRQEQRTPASTRCRCWTGCCRSMSRSCVNSPPAARNGCSSTSPASCSTSIRRPATRCGRLMQRSPRRCPAQDHADDLFWRPRRQPRYRDGAPRRRPSPRSRSCAAPDRRRPEEARRTGAVARRHRRPQHLARRLPDILDRLEPVVAKLGEEPCRSRRPARCFMFRSISVRKPISIPT